MKNWNRILSTLLAALMLCALLPVTAPAEEGIVLDAEDAQTMPADVETLEDLEIVDGNELELDELGELNEELALGDNLEEDMPDVETAPVASNSFTDGDYDHDAFDIDDDGVLMYYYGSGGKVVIPDGVTAIGNSAFYEDDNVTSVVIPEGVEWIGNYAFHGCNSLKNVKIPHGVTNIGEGAFMSCNNLVRVDIPYSVRTIEAGCFYKCSSLTSMNVWGDVNIPSSVTSIGSYAFERCSSIGSVTIPRSVTHISSEAFESCEKLTYVCIPSSVGYIGWEAFNGCSALKSVTIFAKDIEIDDSNEGNFEGCSRKLVVHAYTNSDAYNWFMDRDFTVKPISDIVLLLKGNATQKVHAGDKIQLALDGPKAASYASSNNKVAVVSSNGALTVKKAGTVKITVKTTSGGKWVLTLKVVNAPKLNRTSLSLKKGKSFWLKVNGLLAGRTVTWSSSNKSIATVTNGKVVAKKPGKCTIYAQVKNGVKLKCTVKVNK